MNNNIDFSRSSVRCMKAGNTLSNIMLDITRKTKEDQAMQMALTALKTAICMACSCTSYSLASLLTQSFIFPLPLDEDSL